jgi:hypothetical protein
VPACLGTNNSGPRSQTIYGFHAHTGPHTAFHGVDHQEAQDHHHKLAAAAAAANAACSISL